MNSAICFTAEKPQKKKKYEKNFFTLFPSFSWEPNGAFCYLEQRYRRRETGREKEREKEGFWCLCKNKKWSFFYIEKKLFSELFLNYYYYNNNIIWQYDLTMITWRRWLKGFFFPRICWFEISNKVTRRRFIGYKLQSRVVFVFN